MEVKKEILLENCLVWAKMRYCPYWPAKTVETPPNIGKTPRGKVCVLFFGTKQYGFVDTDKIENYSENREMYISKGKGNDFKLAVKQMDEYISNPTKYHAHAFLKSGITELPIKTERDVELSLGIKTEPKTTKQMLPNESNSVANNWQEEKRILVEQIVKLKTENHENLLALKTAQTECKEVELAKQMLELKLTDIGAIQNNNEKVIANLKRENQTLLARMKQYQTGFQQCNENEKQKKVPSESQDVEYEVEKILNHRDVIGRQYYIRWKGYDSGEDSWENEANLNCAKLLNQYNRSKGLKKKSK